jgi:hypothetical protein
VDAHGNANLLVFPMTHLWLIGPGIGLLGSGRLGANLSHWTWRYLAVSVAAAWGALVLGLLGYQELARWALPMAIFVSALTAAIFRVTRTATPIPSWRPTVDESTQILGNTPSLPWIDSCKESK